MGRTKKLYTFADINAEAEAAAIRMERKSVDRLEDVIDGKDLEIMELKHQIVGYKAVISYLEHQLGLGKSQ
jgi:hypothetical protein